jgi:hypothetical protein
LKKESTMLDTIEFEHQGYPDIRTVVPY